MALERLTSLCDINAQIRATDIEVSSISRLPLAPYSPAAQPSERVGTLRSSVTDSPIEISHPVTEPEEVPATAKEHNGESDRGPEGGRARL